MLLVFFRFFVLFFCFFFAFLLLTKNLIDRVIIAAVSAHHDDYYDDHDSDTQDNGSSTSGDNNSKFPCGKSAAGVLGDLDPSRAKGRGDFHTMPEDAGDDGLTMRAAHTASDFEKVSVLVAEVYYGGVGNVLSGSHFRAFAAVNVLRGETLRAIRVGVETSGEGARSNEISRSENSVLSMECNAFAVSSGSVLHAFSAVRKRASEVE